MNLIWKPNHTIWKPNHTSASYKRKNQHNFWKQNATISAIVYRRSLSYAPFFNWSIFIRRIQNFLNLVIWQPFFLGKFGYFRFSLRCTGFFFIKRRNAIIVFKHFIFVISIIVITARQEPNAGKIGNQKIRISRQSATINLSQFISSYSRYPFKYWQNSDQSTISARTAVLYTLHFWKTSFVKIAVFTIYIFRRKKQLEWNSDLN